MTKKAIFGAAALILAITMAAVSQTRQGPKHHAVFQLTEPEGEAWDMLIPHVENSRAALANEGLEVEVVFFGPGLNMLLKKNKKYEEALKRLADAGVKLSACQNAMRFLNVKSEDLFPFASEVDSGVAQLIRRQEAGWAYIH
jgi:intracellular sulfur oxidation DsrE/DsrF family protein